MGFSSCAFALNSESTSYDVVTGQSKTVVYVSDSIGDDNNSGLSLKKPKKTIKNAILATPEGGMVKIAKGVYKGTNNQDLRLDKSIEIQGEGRDNTIIYGSHQFSLFSIVPSNLVVSLSDLTLTSDRVQDCPAAIWNRAHLNIKKCIIQNNNGVNMGGAIRNDGNCNVTDSSFKNNTDPYDNTPGIVNDGNFNAVNCDFMDLIKTTGSCTIKKSRFTDTVPHRGGIVKLKGKLDVADTTFEGKTVYNRGEDLCTITHCTFQNENWAALTNENGNCAVKDSTFNNNKAREGAAINNMDSGNCTVLNSNFTRNNVKTYGGAICSNGNKEWCSMIIRNCIFTGNTAKTGGAVCNYYTKLNITGCTFTENNAEIGGALYTSNSIYSSLNFNSITKNTASKGKGIYSVGTSNVNALYNWWGSNKGPEGVNEGHGIKADNWLTLSIKAQSNPNKKRRNF